MFAAVDFTFLSGSGTAAAAGWSSSSHQRSIARDFPPS